MLIPLVTAAAINADYIVCKLLCHDKFQEKFGSFEEIQERERAFQQARLEALPDARQETIDKLLNMGISKEELKEQGLQGKTRLDMLEDLERRYKILVDRTDNTDYITYNNRFRKRPTWEDGEGIDKVPNNPTDDNAEDKGGEDDKVDGNDPNSNNSGNNSNGNSNDSDNGGGNSGDGDMSKWSFNPFKPIMEKIIDASFQAATIVPVPNFLLPGVAGTFTLDGGLLPFLVGGAVSQYFAPCILPGMTGMVGVPVVAINTALTTMALGGSMLAAGAADPGIIPYQKFCEGLFEQAKAIRWMVTETTPNGPVVVTSQLT